MGLIRGVFFTRSSYTRFLLFASAVALNCLQLFQFTGFPWNRPFFDTTFSDLALSSSRAIGVFLDSDTSPTHLRKSLLGRRDDDRNSSACLVFCSATFFMKFSSNSRPLYIFQFSWLLRML